MRFNKNGIRSAAIVLAAMLAVGAGTNAQTNANATLIRNVRIFDGEKVIPRGSVLIAGAQITAVGLDLTAPSGAKIVDGTGKTLIPGLINSHVHMVGGFQNNGAAPFEEAAAWGVTTVIDMAGGNPGAVKQELRSGRYPFAADLIGSGTPATVPGGHGHRPGGPSLTKPEEAQAYVDARIAEGADFIKIMSETFQHHLRNIPTLDDATFKAVVDAAHKRGLMVMAHVQEPDRVRRAILAGVDGTVHMPDYYAPSADYGQLFRAHGAFQDTNMITFAERHFTNEIAADPDMKPYFAPWQLKRLSEAKPNERAVHGYSIAHFKQLVAAKVPYVAGTDGANYLLHVEMDIMVRDGGIAPIEALKSATSTPARMFPQLQDRGRIAPGLRADLVLVNGDPTQNIHSTRKIHTIWVRGRIVDREAFRKKQIALPEPRPNPPAQSAQPAATPQG